MGLDARFEMESFTIRIVLAQESYHGELHMSKDEIDILRIAVTRVFKMALHIIK